MLLPAPCAGIFAGFLMVVLAVMIWWQRQHHPVGGAISVGFRRRPAQAAQLLAGPTLATLYRSCRKPEWVVQALICLAGNCPADTGCRTVAALFNRRFAASHGVTVGKTYVACVLRAHRYAIAGQRRHCKHRIPKPMPVNRVWAIDCTGKGDTNNTVHAILGILDHGSRRALALNVIARRCSWTMLGHLCLAIARFGRPDALRTDNEACFTSHLFRTALAALGIRHQRTMPGCPWQNGRVERFFGTLKHKLDRCAVSGARQLEAMLASFALWDNAVRPHQHLGGRTPLEVWNGVDPFARPPMAVTWFSAWSGMLAGFHIRR